MKKVYICYNKIENGYNINIILLGSLCDCDELFNQKRAEYMISKLIPYNIRIKSLYWVRREKEIDKDLTVLFGMIDDDKYSEARVELERLQKKWLDYAQKCPEWFYDHLSQFAKAQSMLDFFNAQNDEI